MSFSIGLSGLRTTSQSLDVISQNIANVSTAGFKASRPELAALYSGGQPGGVELSNISRDFSKDGAKQYSGRDLDIAISGQGFFLVKDHNGQTRYTRAGIFSKDADNFITTSGGLRLQGYAASADGVLNTGVVTDLVVNATNLPANASTTLDFTANLKADAPAIDTVANPFDPADASSYNFSYSSGVFDSLGNEHTLTQYFVKESDNTWRTHFYMDGAAMTGPSDQVITFNTDGSLATPSPATVVLTHAPAGADPMSITLDLRGSTQYSGEFSVTRNATDGYSAGEMTGLRVDDDGTISAVYNNGRTRVQGQIVLAGFTNPNGLAQADSTTWTETFSSGQALLGVAGTGALGTLTPGAYEDSNVDLTGELVNLMTAQRNYQANAKSVSTADQLMQVLFNNM